jgi:hypothetical protein
MFPGETPIQSGQRLLKRELKLEIESERFKPVCAQAFAFGMREQEPKEHGTTDTQFCYKVQLKDEDEYCDSEWKLPSEILKGNYHPALKYAVQCMSAGNALEKLEECDDKGGSDAEIAYLAREFLQRKRAVDDVLKKNDYKLDSKERNYQTTVNSKY